MKKNEEKHTHIFRRVFGPTFARAFLGRLPRGGGEPAGRPRLNESKEQQTESGFFLKNSPALDLCAFKSSREMAYYYASSASDVFSIFPEVAYFGAAAADASLPRHSAASSQTSAASSQTIGPRVAAWRSRTVRYSTLSISDPNPFLR